MAGKCLKCSKYLTCRDPKKGPKYGCDNFKALKAVGSILEIDELELIPRGESPDILLVDHTSKKGRQPSVNGVEAELEAPDEISESVDSADFVWQAMQKAYDPLTNSVRDLKVDDSALKQAKNYFDFCATIAGKAVKVPFARQLWIAMNLLGEYCPRCTHPKWLEIDNVPVDMDVYDLVKKVTFFDKGVCPKCGVTRAAVMIAKEMYDFNQLVMVAGQRAGKSAFTVTLTGYHTHLMLKAPRLSSICRGIQDFTPLTGTFVALTTGRAIKLLWNPYKALLDNSDWFQDYLKNLDDHGNRYGKEFYKSRELFIRFFNKNLDYYPMGPMKRTLRGDTRIFAATDELGLFPFKDMSAVMTDEDEDQDGDGQDDEREMANGDEVHQSLDNSLSTLRTEVWSLYKRNISTVPTGYNLNISSPFSWKDKICRLLKESEDKATLSFGVRLPTWEVNPLYSRDHPVIASAYAKNARRAERDFGANPPRLAENLFRKDMLQASFKAKQHHAIKYDESDPTRTVGHLVELISKARWRPSILGLDAGYSNNSFALVFGHRLESTIEATSAFELMPTTQAPISFPRLYQNVILPLVKDCNIVYMGADRWNSVNMLQQVEEDTHGKCRWAHMTLNVDHFKQFVELVNSGNLILPELGWTTDRIEEVRNYRRELKTRPIDHLYLQFVTVQNKNGIFMKGDGFTDDLFRALAVMCTMHFTPKIRDYVSQCTAKDRDSQSAKAVTAVGGRSAIFAGPNINR